MRALGTGRNAALKLFAILTLGKPVNHLTYAKNTKKLVGKSSEITYSNMAMVAKKVHSICSKCNALE